jgi:DNA-directed RNA polymerase specialized sigma24 family protein
MMNDADDAALYAAMSSDDHQALATLYDRHSNSLFRLAVHMTQSRVVAEDALHDVFVDLMRHARRQLPCGHVKRWLVVRLIERVRVRL